MTLINLKGQKLVQTVIQILIRTLEIHVDSIYISIRMTDITDFNPGFLLLF